AKVDGGGGQCGPAVDHVYHQVEPVKMVKNDHVERGGGGALLDVPAHVHVVVAVAAVGEPVDEPRVAVVGEDHRLLGGEQRVILGVGHAVRVLPLGLQPHQVHHVDHPDLEPGPVRAQQVGRG